VVGTQEIVTNVGKSVIEVPFKLRCRRFNVYAADLMEKGLWKTAVRDVAFPTCVYSDQGGAMKLSYSPLIINLYISKMAALELLSSGQSQTCMFQ